MYALETGANYIRSGRYKKVVVVSGDKMTSITDYQDRSTCPLFGDACGAVLLEPTTEEFGVLDTILRPDGVVYPHLIMKSGGSAYPPSHETVDNREHFVYHAVRNEPGHFLRPEPEKPQSLISHRARCCPVAVIVADNGNRFPFLKSVREHRGGFRGVRERGGRNQSGEPRIHFAFPDNPPPGKHLSERTGETFRLQPCGGGRIVVSGNKAGLHSVFSLNP